MRYIVILLSFTLIGKLSKSKGQVLRVSAAFHVLFCDSDVDLNGQEDVKVAGVTTQIAIVAAQNFVETCCQHAAFIAGRNDINDEITELSTG